MRLLKRPLTPIQEHRQATGVLCRVRVIWARALLGAHEAAAQEGAAVAEGNADHQAVPVERVRQLLPADHERAGPVPARRAGASPPPQSLTGFRAKMRQLLAARARPLPAARAAVSFLALS